MQDGSDKLAKFRSLRAKLLALFDGRVESCMMCENHHNGLEIQSQAAAIITTFGIAPSAVETEMRSLVGDFSFAKRHWGRKYCGIQNIDFIAACYKLLP